MPVEGRIWWFELSLKMKWWIMREWENTLDMYLLILSDVLYNTPLRLVHCLHHLIFNNNSSHQILPPTFIVKMKLMLQTKSLQMYLLWMVEKLVLTSLLVKIQRLLTSISPMTTLPQPCSDVKRNLNYSTKTYAILCINFWAFIRQITSRKITIQA